MLRCCCQFCRVMLLISLYCFIAGTCIEENIIIIHIKLLYYVIGLSTNLLQKWSASMHRIYQKFGDIVYLRSASTKQFGGIATAKSKTVCRMYSISLYTWQNKLHIAQLYRIAVDSLEPLNRQRIIYVIPRNATCNSALLQRSTVTLIDIMVPT